MALSFSAFENPMKLLPFAKIFDLQDGHFLVRKADNSTDGKFEIVFSVSIVDGPDINFTLSFINQENRDRQYDDFSLELAQQFVVNFENHFKENPTDEPTLELVSYEEPAVQQRPLIVVAGDDEYQQIAEELSKHGHADQGHSPLIVMP